MMPHRKVIATADWHALPQRPHFKRTIIWSLEKERQGYIQYTAGDFYPQLFFPDKEEYFQLIRVNHGYEAERFMLQMNKRRVLGNHDNQKGSWESFNAGVPEWMPLPGGAVMIHGQQFSFPGVEWEWLADWIVRRMARYGPEGYEKISKSFRWARDYGWPGRAQTWRKKVLAPLLLTGHTHRLDRYPGILGLGSQWCDNPHYAEFTPQGWIVKPLEIG